MVHAILLIFLPRSFDCLEEIIHTGTCHTRDPYRLDGGPVRRRYLNDITTNLEMFVKFVEHEAHTVHKAVHIRRFTFIIP